MGYVTLVGENTHPGKGRSFSLIPVSRHRERSAEYKPTDAIVRHPGDYHMRPHEWAFALSKMDRGPGPEIEKVPESSVATAISVPTTIVKEVDKQLRVHLANQREYLNRIGSNKWYHPLSTNDVSAYGNAYIKSMQCGPFEKTQLLVSR